MSNTFNDKFNLSDSINQNRQGLWAKTEIIGGYGRHENEFGVTEFDEVLFSCHNLVPLIGVQNVFETLFGVTSKNIKIPTLKASYDIGGTDVKGTDGMIYPYGQKICLFGVGKGGAAENSTNVGDVHYYDTNVNDMVPFRYTDAPNTVKDKYFGRKVEGARTSFYLKPFDAPAELCHKFMNGVDGGDGTDVTQDYINGNKPTDDQVESFIQAKLSISKEDIREWFEYALGNTSQPVVNSIGLYTAYKPTSADDYCNIQLFSKLNIPTESLQLSKDLEIVYRIYGS